MDHSFKIETTNDVTIISFSKKPDLAELFDAMDAVATDQIGNRMWDLSTGFVFNSDELKK